MAWNEPGSGDKDPWGKRGGGNDGPPDLDEVVKNLQRKFAGMFGGNGGSNSQPPEGSNKSGSIGLGLIAAIILLVWLLSGIYIV